MTKEDTIVILGNISKKIDKALKLLKALEKQLLDYDKKLEEIEP